jgi:hypothetical protein
MDNKEVPCKEHPDAPHGFMRNASHSAGRYVCECESWEPPKNKPMTRDEWKEWLAESWDEAQARASTTMIKTWQERCEEHPDHEGIVTERMIRNRMQEEIDELRQAIEQAETREWVGLTDEEVSYCRYAATFCDELDTAYMAELIEQALKEKNT